MTTEELRTKTITLIDSLKSTTGAFGLGNGGFEYKIVIEILLYKFFNDKFGYIAKQNKIYGKRLSNAEKWDAEYDKFTDEEVEDLFCFLPKDAPRMKPIHTLAHLYNAQQMGDFSTILDNTLRDIASLNEDIFAVSTSGKSKVKIFGGVCQFVTDVNRRDEFAISLMQNLASYSFEEVFQEKYDFFSGVFEYLIKDYNNNGGGKYAEYYTPRSIAQVMAMLLVEEGKEYNSVTCYDPSAGTGTLLMALAHQIGENRCSIYSQDISDKSSEMLRLNLILNNLSHSLPNVVQGNTLTDPAHKEKDGTLKSFDFIVSNPPFKLDFPEYAKQLESSGRFWAGVPKPPTKVNPQKPKMAIYTCFIQHVINSLNANGKGAIVVPTGFITSKTGVENEILNRIVDNHIICGVVSMPSNVFANTGTNVSVLFFDKSEKTDDDKVILIDASKLGEEYKEGNNQKCKLRDFEIKKIVDTFRGKEAVEDFSVAISYNDIKDKNYSLSAGQYFDIKIDYVDITEEEFNTRMANYKQTLVSQFEESGRLEKEIIKQLELLKFNK